MPRFRPNVAAMEAYQPGEQPPAGAKVIKLNTNECPYPPSPKVAEAIRAELDAGAAPGDRLRLYSDPGATALRQAAAEAYGFPIECVLHGNGSDELLAMLMRAFVGEGESIAYAMPTYCSTRPWPTRRPRRSSPSTTGAISRFRRGSSAATLRSSSSRVRTRPAARCTRKPNSRDSLGACPTACW